MKLKLTLIILFLILLESFNSLETQNEEMDVDKYLLNSLLFFIQKNRNKKKSNPSNVINFKTKNSIDLSSPLREIRNTRQKLINEQLETKREIEERLEKN